MTTEQFTDLAIKILPGIAIAILASFFSSRWALRRMLADKWWDRKEQAYSEIINAIYDLVQFTEIKKEDYDKEVHCSKERLEELRDRYRDAVWKIKRATTIGAFVISDESAAVLTKLQDRPQLEWGEHEPWDFYEHEYAGYKKALDDFCISARFDLQKSRA